jgi:hypothetical protein
MAAVCTHLGTIQVTSLSRHPIIRSLEPGEDWGEVVFRVDLAAGA